MPSNKRQRQREGRQSRRQAELARQRRASLRRRIITFTVLGAGLLFVIYLFTRDEDATVDTSAATTSTIPHGTQACPKADGSSPRMTEFDGNQRFCIDPVKRDYKATIETDVGTFEVDLLESRAPLTVNNFVALARYHYFDGLTFHRVVPGFVVQGGDPQGTGSGGPGYQFPDELPKVGEYKIGSLAMANSGPNTNGSQFFVITGDQGVQLPPNYSLFGQVTKGMEAVQAIEKDGAPDPNPPTVVHKMVKVTIKETAKKGGD